MPQCSKLMIHFDLLFLLLHGYLGIIRNDVQFRAPTCSKARGEARQLSLLPL